MLNSSYCLNQLAQWLNRTLPPDGRVWLAERLADLQWRRSPRDRAGVQANLTVVLDHAVSEGSPAVREVFRNFARYLVEFLGAHRSREPEMVIEESGRVVSAIQPLQRGIFLSAHLGNWELAAMLLRRLGFRVGVVALPHRDLRVNQFFNRQRLRCGVEVIALDTRAAARCIELLRTGWMLGILGDREFGQQGMVVSFFGRRAVVPRGPAILSLRTGAPVIPVFLIREEPGRFRFYVEPPIWPPSAAEPRGPARGSQGQRVDTHVHQLTQAYVTVIERYVRRFPSQWLMFQPVFDDPTPCGGLSKTAHAA
jgi:KDO2-lipid IV(A) lauroyltransferase